jgi:methylthioribose-1-phosphate isomerase
MAGATSAELIAAVSEAGGLGVLGASFLPPEEIAALVARARELTSKPLGINVLVYAMDDHIDDVLALEPRVISTAWARDDQDLAALFAKAHERGCRVHVFVDETRPLLQGARLTVWELMHAGIPCTLITDAAAATLMRQAKVDVVLVGADRICANGDFANKIGTYGLAVLAHHHGVPFYCAAPWSTVDASLPEGDLIPIEQRAPAEVTVMAGRPIAPHGAAALNPAFDVTPARYVTGFITDRGILQPPFTGS